MGTRVGLGRISKVAKDLIQFRFKRILAHASQKTILNLNGTVTQAKDEVGGQSKDPPWHHMDKTKDRSIWKSYEEILSDFG